MTNDGLPADDEPRARSRSRSRSGGGRPGLVVGAVLFVIGAVSFGWSSTLHTTTTTKVVGGNLPVNAQAVDPLVVTAENSPALVANPRDAKNLVIVHRVDRPSFGCGMAVSSDAGATWKQASIATAPGKTISCFSPDAAFGADGTLYVTFTSFANVPEQGNAPDALWVAKSTDGGKTIGAPTMVSGPLAFQARVATDKTTARRVFATWVQAAGTSSFGFSAAGNPILVSRSDDGGATWSKPTQVNPTSRMRVVAPIPLSGDALYVAYVDVGNDRLDYEGAHEGKGGPAYSGAWSLVVARSGDGGMTWHESTAEQQIVPAQRFIQLFPPSPSFTAHGNTLYLAFADARAGDADVYLWRSTDGGAHWSKATKVNDTRAGDGRAEYLPTVATSPGGRVDVAYYDRRADPGDAQNEVSLQTSFDDGHTFSPRVKVSDRSFDSRMGFGSDREMPDLGTRLGLLSTDAGALSMWADTRNGTTVLPKQLLARAVVSIGQEDPTARAPLRIGGLIAMAVGLAIAGLTWWARRA